MKTIVKILDPFGLSVRLDPSFQLKMENSFVSVCYGQKPGTFHFYIDANRIFEGDFGEVEPESNLQDAITLLFSNLTLAANGNTKLFPEDINSWCVKCKPVIESANQQVQNAAPNSIIEKDT